VFGKPRVGDDSAKREPDAMLAPLSLFFAFSFVVNAFAFIVTNDDFPKPTAVTLRTVTLNVKEKATMIATPQR